MGWAKIIVKNKQGVALVGIPVKAHYTGALFDKSYTHNTDGNGEILYDVGNWLQVDASFDVNYPGGSGYDSSYDNYYTRDTLQGMGTTSFDITLRSIADDGESSEASIWWEISEFLEQYGLWIAIVLILVLVFVGILYFKKRM